MKDNSMEIFPVVDPQGNVIGKATRGECHSGSKLLHPVVHIHIFDGYGRLFLQKRPEWKDIQPGRWDTAVGGHVDYGERIEDAALREAREEVGLNVAGRLKSLGSYVFESDRERELINAFRLDLADGEWPVPSDELDGGRFWTPAEIADSLGKSLFTPNFESEYARLFL
ncbi:MAG: NUDIX domain-containing protein [Lachnoclostridium sp.]|nr:NUDIX domain-containing protein [Lachnoclostridium sp.]